MLSFLKWFAAVWLITGSPFAQADWQLQPSTCVVEQAGKSCQMQVVITNPESLGQNICVVFEDTTLMCSELTREGLSVPVRFERDGELRIYLQEQLLHSELLKIQTLTGKKTRRRIRLPWSIF